MTGFVLAGRVKAAYSTSYERGGVPVSEFIVTIAYFGGTATTKGPLSDDGYEVGEDVCVAVDVELRKYKDTAFLEITRQGRVEVGAVESVY